MTIKIKYKIVKFKAEKSINDIQSSFFTKDISWGSHTDLLAAESTCGNYNWKNYEPDFHIERDDEFHLIFKNECFDFDREGINHFIGTVAGNIISNSDIFESIIVDDFEFTKDIYDLNIFPGPSMSIDELRNELFLRTFDPKKPRPIIAFSIKPRMGMSINDYQKILEATGTTEIDIVEDDERLVDPIYCSFNDRLSKIQEQIDCKSYPQYSINLTGNPLYLKEKLDKIYNAGIRIVKLDVMVAGFDTLLQLRNLIKDKYKNEIAITVFPDVYGSHYRCLSRKFILKLSRLCGANIIYAGSRNWSRYGLLEKDYDLINNHNDLINPILNATNIKTCLPTLTHDFHPSRIEHTIYDLRKGLNNHMEYAFFVGGGISGWPIGNIEDSINLLIDVVGHASKVNLSQVSSVKDFHNLDNYDYGKYDKPLRDIGWPPFM